MVEVNLDDPVCVTELLETPAGRHLLWRKQVEISKDGEIKGLLFWDGVHFDEAAHRAHVLGTKSQLLAAIDALMPLFMHVDFDL